MGYTALSTATVDVMKKGIEALQKEVTDTTKKDKKKGAELQKSLDAKWVALAKKLVDEIKVAKAGCDQMTLKVEDSLGQAMKFNETAKATLARYQKTHESKDLMVLEGAPGTIKALADIANKEMMDFAQTWDCYRQWNSGDPKATAEFNSIRNSIMELTKTSRGKVTRIETMSKEAEAYKKAGAEASSLTLATPEEKVAEAKDITKRLNEMLKPLNGGKETVDAVITNGTKFTTYTKGPIAGLKTMLKNLETQYSFTVKSVQTFTSTVASMQKVLATGKASIQPAYMKDSKVAAAVKEADDLVTYWAGEVKKAQTAMTTMAKDLKVAQDRVKAGK